MESNRDRTYLIYLRKDYDLMEHHSLSEPNLELESVEDSEPLIRD